MTWVKGPERMRRHCGALRQDDNERGHAPTETRTIFYIAPLL